MGSAKRSVKRAPRSAVIDPPMMVAAVAVVATYQGTMIHGRFAQSPMRTARRLSRKIPARPMPSRICNPKNGEKLRKTPSARPAAVRCGELSSASRRRSRLIPARRLDCTGVCVSTVSGVTGIQTSFIPYRLGAKRGASPLPCLIVFSRLSSSCRIPPRSPRLRVDLVPCPPPPPCPSSQHLLIQSQRCRDRGVP
jgi:hypothetical protein